MKKAASQKQDDQTQGNYSNKSRDQFVAKLFPEKNKQCAECGRNLTDRNRKRMVIARKVTPIMGSISGYQLCRQCAGFLQKEEMHRLPNIARDMTEADFLALGQTVGGVQ